MRRKYLTNGNFPVYEKLQRKYNNLTLLEEYVLNTFDKRNWDFNMLSTNPAISIEFIEKYSLQFNPNFVCSNPNITLKYLEKHRSENLNFERLSCNLGITKEILLKFIKKPWNMPVLSKNPSITPDILESVNLQWSLEDYSANTSITLDFCRKYKEKLNYRILSSNPSLSQEFIAEILNFVNEAEEKYTNEQNEDLKSKYKREFQSKYVKYLWDEVYLSQNPVITPDLLIKHKNFKWNAKGLSQNPSMTLDFILSSQLNFDFDKLSQVLPIDDKLLSIHRKGVWSCTNLSKNSGITSKWIEKYPSKLRNFTEFSKSTEMTTEFIDIHINSFNIEHLSGNSSITPEIIEKHPNKPWMFGSSRNDFSGYTNRGLSGNTSINPEFIEKYIHERWEFNYISLNTFEIAQKRKDEDYEKLLIIASLSPNIPGNDELFKDNKRYQNCFTEKDGVKMPMFDPYVLMWVKAFMNI